MLKKKSPGLRVSVGKGMDVAVGDGAVVDVTVIVSVGGMVEAGGCIGVGAAVGFGLQLARMRLTTTIVPRRRVQILPLVFISCSLPCF
jgi:hypothetical protein